MTEQQIPPSDSIVDVEFDATGRLYLTFEDDDGNRLVGEYDHVKTQAEDEFSGIPP